MAWQLKRLVLACGLVVSTAAFFGSTAAVNPPDDEPKKPAAPSKSKPAAEKAPPDKHAPEKAPAEKAGHGDKEDAHAPKVSEDAPQSAKPKAADTEKKEKDDSRPSADESKLAPDNAKDALEELRTGNLRWVKDKDTNPNTDPSRRTMVAEQGQKPFATILTCADSRIPVERVFDRGVGDLFVIRVAGNVVGADASGTIEYGAEHLHVPLLVVMGHTKCGAVGAAAAGAAPGGNVTQLVEKISPAVARVKQMHPEMDEKELAAEAVRENVWQSIFDLIKTSAVVREMVHEKKIQIVGAVYDVASGKVEWIGEHPWQDSLVEAFEAKSTKIKDHAEAKADEH